MGNRGGGMHNGMGPAQNINPELRAEIRNYAQQNIIPVITKEREAFDDNLSDTEKEQIALAQGKRKARRIMFREYYKSADFEQGSRRDDPNFDALREDMQKSMTEVRAIAAAHSEEIKKAMDNICTYSKVWESEISAIADKYQSGQQKKNGALYGHIQRMENPVNFLMFDLKSPENTSLFDIDRKEMVLVDVFPNPATSHATVRISGVGSRQTVVKLYSKEGKLIKSLYNEKVVGEEVSFGFDVSDLDNDIYIIKVKAGDFEVARKIIVQQ
jgi:siroheme synthase (precorrin-2 oxidase/ferrochelatase)